MHHKLSLRASVTSELVLRDVRVPEENRFPEASTPARRRSPASTRRATASSGAPSARRARASRRRSTTRRSGSSSASRSPRYQLTQQKLAEMALEVNRGALVALHLGRMKDDGTLRPEHVSMGKMGNVRGALEVAPLGALDPRRQRHHARVPGDPAHEQPRVRPHVRGHARGAHARRRRRAHRRERVPHRLDRMEP